MEEYAHKLAAVQCELQDLLDQDHESASGLSSGLFNPTPDDNNFVSTRSGKALQDK
ncbi:hypothetical protein JG687_00015583 [Phytophthora cactorum]|uniref:Uncharacterized protein n=1 Tax=Phytophthora cactorum TaxID=29920 RepID=A0A8T1TUB7_9STRA|nr:hypothetical protein PC120_g25105 [Phytophthora cactorum]KAG3042761.1 hypothetical protein PC121_g22972 [Phytophthora cactorum]KAG4038835.1 hypothetical protein PC123_g25604 [Phytophthora cactorum]KAG6948269.1 hypothetical protein JG687_00015583 [Phytophthora cactorum]